MKVTRMTVLLLLSGIILVSGSFPGYAPSNLFFDGHSHVAPQSSAMVLGSLASGGYAPYHPPPSPPALKKGCSQLSLDSSDSSVPPFAGAPAVLVYGCGKTGSHPAFSTEKSNIGQGMQVTPIFTLPLGWTLGIGIAHSSGDCSSSYGMVTLNSGVPLTLLSRADYVYCLTTSSASSFSTFSISWSQ